MKRVAIVQAHMGSSRLPGKVMKDLAGTTMLGRVVERVRRCRRVDEVIVAMSTLPADDVLEAHCRRDLQVPLFRGSESDVLNRFLHAARAYEADICIRITSDCPLIDPGVTDEIIRRFEEAAPPVDYCSNKIPQSFPRGLDSEVFSRAALERAAQLATQAYERAHVTIYMYEHPETFRLLSVTSDVDRADWRWTVDTPEDLAFVQRIYDELGPDRPFGWEEVVELLEERPELRDINRHIVQKPVTAG